MAKIFYALENQMESGRVGGFSDIAAGLAFLAMIIACGSLLML